MKSTLRLNLTLLFVGFLTVCYGQTVLAEKHFESDNVQMIKVIGSFCDVNVVQRDRLVFDGLIKGDGDPGDYVIAVIQSGNEVIFKVERKKDRNWGWNDIDVARLNLSVPEGIDLSIENTSGDVLIEGLVSKSLDITATSGDLTLKKVNSSIQMRTTSGDVMVRDATGDITMKSTSGDQEYFEITGNLKTVATSGDVEIDRLIGMLDVSTTSGDIDFDTVEGVVSATATSGEIDGDYVLLKGDSRFKSTSGNIHVRFKNNLDDLEFNLRASSGDIEMGEPYKKDSQHRKLDIEVTGITTSGDQTYTN